MLPNPILSSFLVSALLIPDKSWNILLPISQINSLRHGDLMEYDQDHTVRDRHRI